MTCVVLVNLLKLKPLALTERNLLYYIAGKGNPPSPKKIKNQSRPTKINVQSSFQWGTEDIQFMSELHRFLRDEGGWEPQSTAVRKGRGEFLTPLSDYCALSKTYRVQA